MAYEFITFDIRANVAEIVLNRPDRLNAITPRMLAEIGAALDGAVAQGARAILMTGAGRRPASSRTPGLPSSGR